MRVLHYDAFSTVPGRGNPAGVIFDADGLSPEEMQAVAKRVGFNECAFVCRSETADLRLRYFTPGHEMDLCGHGTIAAIFALDHQGKAHGVRRIETRAGVLGIGSERDPDGNLVVTMQQNPARFQDFGGDRLALASALGLGLGEIEHDLPLVYGSTGTWTLLVPIKELASFRRMRPDNQAFPRILAEMPRASVHPFCLQTIHPDTHLHGRHFSSAYSGTVEDPVTGTASAAMAAWWLRYLRPHAASADLLIEQGQEIGRDGRVRVKARRQADEIHLEIAGTAVFVKCLSECP